jgi:hypothetical protein
MRPVERGAWPTDGDGCPKVFGQYTDARADLFERLGRYCSFCERPIKAGLAVEHVLAKSLHPNLELVWDNFLLACANCNSTKGDKPVFRKKLFLPDQDNTFLALSYRPGGLIRRQPTLIPTNKSKATRLIQLVGLDCGPNNNPTASDLRWNDRREAWDKAERYRNLLQLARTDNSTLLQAIVDLSKADGHWSIWMTVFANHTKLRQRLIAEHPGTAANCFDGVFNPSARPGGQI